MINRIQTLLILLVATFLFSCKSDSTDSKSSQSADKVQVANGYEILPRTVVERMWNEAEMLDYIFHELPFSMNQSEKPSIQANITYISSEPQPQIPAGCKPMARQFYQVKGEIELEADIYFGNGCHFYVFFVDGKAQYANKMSQAGIDFFTNMIGKAMNASKQSNG